jgi:hypothetical protein
LIILPSRRNSRRHCPVIGSAREILQGTVCDRAGVYPDPALDLVVFWGPKAVSLVTYIYMYVYSSVNSVGIHEHCTVTEILVFGRETGFPTQILQRWYLHTSPQEMETNLIKGTVSRDFLTLVFFIKHLLLVPLDTPRKDFDFFRIVEELFEFVIDSPVYSLPGSRDSPVYSSPGSRDSPLSSSPGSRDFPVVNTPGSRPKLVKKRTFWCKILQGVETPLCLIHWGVLTPWSIIHKKIVL